MTAAFAIPAPPAARPVTIRPAPRREPPFDDELPLGHHTGRLDQPLPFDAPQPIEASLRLVRAMPPATRQGQQPSADPALWGRRLLIGLIECAAGHRPLQQLSTLLSPAVARGLGIDFERAAVRRRRHWLHDATVRTVHASEPAPGVAELCATLSVGPRARAVAIRLEECHGRWRCVLLQVG